MKTYWLNGEIIPEKLNHTEEKVELNEQEKVNHVTIDEGIDEIDEITFTFHVSDHDKENCKS